MIYRVQRSHCYNDNQNFFYNFVDPDFENLLLYKKNNYTQTHTQILLIT